MPGAPRSASIGVACGGIYASAASRSSVPSCPYSTLRLRDDTAALLRDHGEDSAADALPETCPYTVEQITGDWWP